MLQRMVKKNVKTCKHSNCLIKNQEACGKKLKTANKKCKKRNVNKKGKQEKKKVNKKGKK